MTMRFDFRAIATPMVPWLCDQTTHGRHCQVPPGWDADHSDQATPYTVDQLAARDSSPHRWAYATVEQYLRGHTLWRVLQRDARLNPTEARVLYETKMAWIAASIDDPHQRAAFLEAARGWTA